MRLKFSGKLLSLQLLLNLIFSIIVTDVEPFAALLAKEILFAL